MTAAAAIETVPFRNPRFPALPFEAMTLAELRSRVPGRHLRLRSRLHFHQLVYLAEGRTPHDVDFVRFELQAGSVLHVRPGQVQQLVLQPRAQGTVLLFAPEFVPREPVPGVPLHVCRSVLDAAAPQSLLELAPAQRAPVAAAFATLLHEYERQQGTPLDAAVLRHLLAALLLVLARAGADAEVPGAAASAASRVHSRFAQALEQDFARSRSVLWYARKLGYSEKTLLRACQAMAGLTPKEMIDGRVALEAKRLLAHTQQPVGSIAADVGFSETTNFVKFFRRREGVSPGEFRHAHAGA